jgi:tRNA-splicing ligase RtcB
VSLKYAAQKLSENHYVLPKVGSMRVDVHAFLSEALYASTDEQVWQQIMTGASYEGVIGAYLMPDTHVGYGVPVGSVIVTEDTLIQGGSGYDISCGVLYMRADLTAFSVKSKHARARWVTEVERRVATGKGHSRPDRMPKFSRKEADDVLRFGAKALGVNADL